MMTAPPPGAHTADPLPAGRSDAWRPDRLLAGFECVDLALDAAPAPGEPEDPLVGTLIRRADPSLRLARRAVLSLHGWNDYFFHPHVAEFAEREGFAWYAVDLRRYGRSRRPGQFPGYIESLDDYAAELDAATAIIAESHEEVLLMGHSTGGLVAALWASTHPGRLAGVLLNSPWLDMPGSPAVTAALTPLLSTWSRRSPASVLPLPELEGMVYARTLHTSFGGEWDYDLELKYPRSCPARVGWLRAVLRGHAAVARGLDIDCPVFVATSERTQWLRRFRRRAREADTVLDVDKIAAAAWRLGDCVTLVRIPDGLHDLSLSPEPVRGVYFAEIARWWRAYVPPAGQAVSADAAAR